MTFREEKTTSIKRFQTCKHSFVIACLSILTCSPILVSAQTPMAGTINRMPIEKMKAEFDAKGATYGKTISKKIKPYINKVCETLADTSIFHAKQRQEINTIKQQLGIPQPLTKQYELWEKLFRIQFLLNFEDSYQCARHCEELALQLANSPKANSKAPSTKSPYDYLAQAYIYEAQAFTNSGYFREAAETLAKIAPGTCSQDIRINYIVAAFNLEFENGFYTPYRILSKDTYLENMKRLYGELKQTVPSDSYLLDDMLVKMYFHETKYAEAIKQSKILLSKLSPTSAYYAYALGNLGYNYMGLRNYTKAAECISQSAIMEIKRGSVEYPAARKIAEIAYITGDIARSYMLINVAMHNAEQYHSRYRYSEIAFSYPQIDKDLYAITQRQKMWLTIGLIFLSIVIVLLIAAIIVMKKQRKTLHRQKSLIESQMKHLYEKNVQIASINKELIEAGHIKEVVLSQLIVGSANHQVAIEKLRKEVLRRLTIRDYEGLKNVFDAQKGAAFDTFYQMDSILQMLFPDFEESFNSLLRPECRIVPKTGERLTVEMRIFALIRLGITKNEDLARSLNYSVNTIKSYKTRVLNAARYDKEEFYKRLKEKVNTEI